MPLLLWHPAADLPDALLAPPLPELPGRTVAGMEGLSCLAGGSQVLWQLGLFQALMNSLVISKILVATTRNSLVDCMRLLVVLHTRQLRNVYVELGLVPLSKPSQTQAF